VEVPARAPMAMGAPSPSSFRKLEELRHLGLQLGPLGRLGQPAVAPGGGPPQSRFGDEPPTQIGGRGAGRDGARSRDRRPASGARELGEFVDQGGGDGVDRFVEGLSPVEELGPEDLELLET
jgi:hypothetical protein